MTNGNLLSVQDQKGEIHQVSLYGIDAPDNEQKMGPHAGKMLAAMVHEKDVEVRVEEVDSRGRPNVEIMLKGVSVNAAMVKSGYAWVNPEICKTSACSAWTGHQQYASHNKKGLWVDPDAEPPWKWRERRAKAETIAKQMRAANQHYSYDSSYSGQSQNSSPARVDNREKTVQVKGYYRKDGTYVHPHTRRPPSR